MTIHKPVAVFPATWAGQAGWCDPATTKTCRECVFWGLPGSRYERSAREYFGRHELKPRPCMMSRRLNPEITAPVPHDAKACGAHFSPNPEPPPIFAKHARRDS
jgi:hypothetical protein